MSYIVNQEQLSRIVGYHRKTLTMWGREGMPCVHETENGLANQYDTESVIRWLVAREAAKFAGGESAKDRHSRLQGDKIELELAELRGQLVPAAAIEPTWAAMTVAARQTALAMPARLAPMIATMVDPDSIRLLLEEEVETMLQKLSTYDPGGSGEAPESPAPAAAAGDGCEFDQGTDNEAGGEP